ncbi:MAG: PIN domain-containing protein [Deltaproteobacteria bacterium]|nr:PIN domain-containing protein [Deltaproteobacteria bacterium]
MVLIDTSVWISLFRKRESDLGLKMWSLLHDNLIAICGQVLVEYVGGFRNEIERKNQEKKMLLFPFLDSPLQVYRIACSLMAKYPRLGASDSIIAATAMHHKALLFTLDKDFSVLEPEGLKLF